MRVLATGATGKFAGLVVPALVSRGIDVRAVVHEPGRKHIPLERGAGETVDADLRDRPACAPRSTVPTACS